MKYYGIILLIVLFSCEDTQIMETNLVNKGERFVGMLADENVNYLFGIEGGQNTFNSCNNTFIYRNIPGNAKWDRLKVELKGAVSDWHKNNEVFYFISKCQDKYNILKWDGNTTVTVIYQSDERINQVYFRNKNEGYIDVGDILYKTIDAGEEWKKINTQNKFFGFFIFQDDEIYFLSRSRIRPKDRSLEVLNSSALLPLLEINVTDIFIERKNDYWFLGKVEENTTLKRYKNGKWKEIKVFSKSEDVFPERLHKHGDFIAVLFSGIDDTLLGGFGGTRYMLYVSKDNGENWEQIKLPNDTYVKPYIFYQDKRFVAYSGQGRITNIDFK